MPWRTWGYASLLLSSRTTFSPTTSTAWTRRCVFGVFMDISQFKMCQLYTTDSIPFHSLFNLQDHSHTPWIIIVAKHLEKWLSEVQHIFCGLPSSKMSDKYSITDIYAWLLLLHYCMMKWLSTFVLIAQLSATEKLQGERDLQTAYSRRYLWTSGLSLPVGSVTWLVTKLICDFFCSFRDPEEWEWCPRGRRKLWRSY